MNINKLMFQAILILAVSTLLGFANNLLNPNGLRITNVRPKKVAAEDAVFQDAERVSREPVIINKQQLKELIKKGEIFVIDTRDTHEYAAGKIPDAINIPFETLGEHIETIDNLPKAFWIVTYCEGPPCDKSRLLAEELVNNGFERVAYYEAGLNDWVQTEDVQR